MLGEAFLIPPGGHMAVRDALLALLTAGPAYGFQLHGGLAARTGGRRAINVGQTYATLDRLTRQKLVEPAGATDDGLPLHRLTDAGLAAARAWLDGTDAAGADQWDETIDRVLIARSLPDCDADAIVAAELGRWRVRRDEASLAVARTPAVTAEAVDAHAATRGAPAVEADAAEPAEAALVRLAASADLARAEAALAWLAALGGVERLAFAPRAERPKRGRRPGPTPAPVPPSAGRADADAQPADA
jgi:DNA-binding PadR family transcriptional regulator